MRGNVLGVRSSARLAVASLVAVGAGAGAAGIVVDDSGERASNPGRRPAVSAALETLFGEPPAPLVVPPSRDHAIRRRADGVIVINEAFFVSRDHVELAQRRLRELGVRLLIQTRGVAESNDGLVLGIEWPDSAREVDLLHMAVDPRLGDPIVVELGVFRSGLRIPRPPFRARA